MDRIFKTAAGFTILIAIIMSVSCILLLKLMDNTRIAKYDEAVNSIKSGKQYVVYDSSKMLGSLEDLLILAENNGYLVMDKKHAAKNSSVYVNTGEVLIPFNFTDNNTIIIFRKGDNNADKN